MFGTTELIALRRAIGSAFIVALGVALPVYMTEGMEAAILAGAIAAVGVIANRYGIEGLLIDARSTIQRGADRTKMGD